MSKRANHESSNQEDQSGSSDGTLALNLNLSPPIENERRMNPIALLPSYQDALNKDPLPRTNTQPLGERRAHRPHHQPIDTILIETIPRFKQSTASGDEWRYSARLQFKSKGDVILEKHYGNVEEATKFVCAEYAKLTSFSKAHLFCTPDGNLKTNDICDQEGCLGKATKTFKLKYEYNNQGVKKDPYNPESTFPSIPLKADTRPLIRKFCDGHSHRGDCGLEDSDDNYEQITHLTPKSDDGDNDLYS